MAARSHTVTAIRSVAGQAVAQGSNAVAALARIPILVVALSPSGYGTYSLVQALVPWLLVLPLGLRFSVRAMGAESRHSSGDDARVLGAHLAEARRLGLLVLLPGVVACAVLTVLWPRVASPSGSTGEALVVLLATLALCVTTFPGNVRMGLLESRDQLGLVNLLGAATGVGGLALTYLLWRLGAPYALFAVAGVAAAAAPAWCAELVRTARSPAPAPEAARLRPFVRRNARTFLSGSVALLLAAGLVPFIVGALLTTRDVATYTIAARLTVVVTLLPTALTPWLWNRQARLKASDRKEGHLESLRLVLLASLACGLVLSVVFALAGPTLGHLLGATNVPAPRALYVAFALHGLVQFAQAPLSASLTGPRGARFMNISTACASVAALLLAVPLTLLVGVSGPVWALAGCYGAMMVVWWASIRRMGGYLEDSHAAP